ncbi:MAG: pilus assembly protein PilM [Candidatus Omnitrophica bacterium]|nr:pilus assembly protein PilM [Candidatus Omnitrophota bacterium]MBU1924423.1 pilus assembly protein PilM [Candidatus Omnitrophota bacterium]
MFKKFQEAVGIEIGDGLIKAVFIRSHATENQLIAYEAAKVNFIEGRDGLIKAIKEVLEKIPLNPKKHKINISVSGESVVVRDIHWPQMSDVEIKKALQFEVERQVHFKLDEIVFDYYSVLDKTVAETKTRVVLIAAKKNLIDNYTTLITDSGYISGFVEVDTFSLMNCFYASGPQLDPAKTVAIINVGLEVTNIDIIKGKIVGLTKDAFVAWNNLIDALPENIELDFNNISNLKGLSGSDDIYELCSFIMNALSNQISRTIEFFESQGQDSVSEIFLSGRIALFKNLDKYLESVLGLKITLWNPLSNIKLSVPVTKRKEIEDNSLMLALCVGLACWRHFYIDLSVKKAEVKKNVFEQFISKYKEFFQVAGIFIFFLLSVWVVLFSQIKIKNVNRLRLERQNQQVIQVLRDIDQLKEGRKKLEGHMTVVQALFSHRILWSRTLYEISRCVPENLWITDLAFADLRPEELAQTSFALNILKELTSATLSGFEGKSKLMVIFIKGQVYAPTNDQMLSVLNKFINDMKDNERFGNDFKNVELIRTYHQKVVESNVMRFEMECF